MPLINVFFWVILLLGAIAVFLIVSAQAQAEARARRQLLRCAQTQPRRRPAAPAGVRNPEAGEQPEFRFYIIDRTAGGAAPAKNNGQAEKNICA